jgi:hypothetical protein
MRRGGNWRLAREIKGSWNPVIGFRRRRDGALVPVPLWRLHRPSASAHREIADCRLNPSFRLFFNEPSTNPI